MHHSPRSVHLASSLTLSPLPPHTEHHHCTNHPRKNPHHHLLPTAEKVSAFNASKHNHKPNISNRNRSVQPASSVLNHPSRPHSSVCDRQQVAHRTPRPNAVSGSLALRFLCGPCSATKLLCHQFRRDFAVVLLNHTSCVWVMQGLLRASCCFDWLGVSLNTLRCGVGRVGGYLCVFPPA